MHETNLIFNVGVAHLISTTTRVAFKMVTPKTEIELPKCPVRSVVVYPDRAEVTRLVQVTLDAGEHEIQFKNISKALHKQVAIDKLLHKLLFYHYNYTCTANCSVLIIMVISCITCITVLSLNYIADSLERPLLKRCHHFRGVL